jgi:hypothetical protein
MCEEYTSSETRHDATAKVRRVLGGVMMERGGNRREVVMTPAHVSCPCQLLGGCSSSAIYDGIAQKVRARWLVCV